MKENQLTKFSMEFCIDIINLVKYLKANHESIISNQIGRSRTSIGGQWCSTQLHFNQGAPIISFVTAEWKQVFEARAKMNEQNLLLYKFKVYDNSFTRLYDIKLFKFTYQEQNGNLPFAPVK